MSSAYYHPLPYESANCFFTDPPYYDAVPYSDLSDFFVVWLKRSLNGLHNDLFLTELAPKDDECIVDDAKGKDNKYFEISIGKAMSEGRRVLASNGIGAVVFAHKSTSGWESLLQAMIDAGWIFTASWPIDTERPGRLRAHDSAALSSSIHLICRPRENDDGSLKEEIGDWRAVLNELPKRIAEWMPRLAKEGVVGADAIFACLGPALEIFSRYSKVEKSNGDEVALREYLEQVWAAVSKEALKMIFKEGNVTGFEEDARLTAMWLWTLSEGTTSSDSSKVEKSQGYTLEFDAARKIAQGLGAHLEKLDHLIEIKGDKARLLPVVERVKHLLGKESFITSDLKKDHTISLFEDVDDFDKKSDDVLKGSAYYGLTILDSVHYCMLMFKSGRSEAIKRYFIDDGKGKDSRFWDLAQALSALYPATTDEKRWVDGLLASKKSMGL